MKVYKKVVQVDKRDNGWCEYPDGHLDVYIFYNHSYSYKDKGKVHLYRGVVGISVWGRDDTGMELVFALPLENELSYANKMIGRLLCLYHSMPKRVGFDWLTKHGFVNA